MSMMYQPLLISSIIQQAAINFPQQKVFSRNFENGVVELSYHLIYERSQRLSNALMSLRFRISRAPSLLPRSW